MEYIDGFVAAVPTANKEQYLDHACKAAVCFKDHGASRLIECWEDDVPDGDLTSFIKAVHCQANETVVFSWLVWPSKEARDKGMEAAMNDERLHPNNNPMPFDGKRLIYGGFEKLLDE